MTPPVKRDNLLPANATAFEDGMSQTSGRLLDAPSEVVRAARKGATAPKQLLGHLGWEKSLHHPSDDEATQRARIDASFADHLSYGSPDALEREIALDTGLEIRVVEYFEEVGLEWPDFIVEARAAQGDPAPDMTDVRPSALARKNVRDWPKLRTAYSPVEGALYVASASHFSPRMKILSAAKPPPQLFVGSASRFLPRMKILPLRA